MERLFSLLLKIFSRMLPDWSDVEAVREFVLKVMPAIKVLAELTKTQIDDKMVDALDRLATNQEMWAEFYGLIVSLFNGEEMVEGNPRVAKLADNVGIDPTIIIAIITAIMEFIKWWRSRNGEKYSTTENND